jgi:uncharacterized protein
MLKDQIKKKLNDSLKSGDQLKRSVLGMLSSAIQSRELAKRTQLAKTKKNSAELEMKSQLTDEEILEVIASEIKKRKESIEQFNAGNRKELAEKEAKEIEILKPYLPEQLSEPEVSSEIDKIIIEVGAKDIKDMGKIIGLAMNKLKGKIDGATVSRLVKEKLHA